MATSAVEMQRAPAPSAESAAPAATAPARPSAPAALPPPAVSSSPAASRRPALAGAVRPLAGIAFAAAAALLAVWVWAGFRPSLVTRQDTTLKYREEIGLSYTAAVTPGAVYAKPVLQAEDLPRWTTQTDPPIARRALVARPLERLTVEFPYTLTFDRPVTVSGTVQADSYLVGQRLWQRPLALVAPQEVRGQDTKIAGSLRVDLDVRALSDQLAQGYAEAGLVPSTGEVWLDPVVTWQAVTAAPGDVPVSGSLAGSRLVVYLMGDHLEIEERQPAVKEQSLTSAQQQVNTLSVLNRAVPLATLRRLAGWGAILFGGLALALFWLAQRRAGDANQGSLGRLALAVDAAGLTLDPSWALVQVNDPKDLLRLHALMGRPIIRVDGAYYLLDGTTCYRYAAPPADA